MWHFVVVLALAALAYHYILMRKVIRLLLYQTMLSCTGNEFNLELVHFSNGRALIAGLKGFTLFWQQKLFIKFTYLFTLTESVETPSEPTRNLALWYIVKRFRLDKGVRFIYQFCETTNVVRSVSLQKRKPNAGYWDQLEMISILSTNFLAKTIFWNWARFSRRVLSVHRAGQSN